MSRLTFALMLASVASLGAQTPADPVGFPRDLHQFEQVRSMSTTGANPQLGLVKLNGPAATVTVGETRSYPYGSVAVMEWWTPAKDKLVRFDVMRKERGFGASYESERSGEWEFASYSPDGKLLTTAAEGKACASCHRKAGEGRDFVYAGRFAPAR